MVECLNRHVIGVSVGEEKNGTEKIIGKNGWEFFKTKKWPKL